MATVTVKGIEARRGVLAAFRHYLNERHRDAPRYCNRRWRQKSRAYGDYLYHQDRPMFDEALWRALQGRDFPGFDAKPWLVQKGGTGK